MRRNIHTKTTYSGPPVRDHINQSINQTFYSANIPGEGRLSGVRDCPLFQTSHNCNSRKKIPLPLQRPQFECSFWMVSQWGTKYMWWPAGSDSALVLHWPGDGKLLNVPSDFLRPEKPALSCVRHKDYLSEGTCRC